LLHLFTFLSRFNNHLQWRFFLFHHLTLKLDQVKHSSYTYIRDAALDKCQELTPTIWLTCRAIIQASSLSRHVYSAVIASKLNVKE